MVAHAQPLLLRPAAPSSTMISDHALDLIIETLISTADAHRRALVVHNLVLEIHAIVSWLGSEESGSELASVSEVLTAAREHLRRMEGERALAAVGRPGG